MALEENTTVSHLVRECLSERLRERDRRSTAQAAIRRSFGEIRVRVGQPDWTREDLHQS